MFKELVINITHFEKRIAVIENNQLVELFIEKENKVDIVGSIYKGIIKDVIPTMGSAFINIGLERTGFLPYSDLFDNYTSKKQAGKDLSITNINDSTNISKFLKAGDEIIVQLLKGPLGKKGARLTKQLSLPGKFLVFLPNQQNVAISKKISNKEERSRIKAIFNKIKDSNIGIIVRTEGEKKNEEEFIQEYNQLLRTWKHIQKQIRHIQPPECIYSQNDFISFLTRDLFTSEINRVVVDDKKTYRQIFNRLKDISPNLIDRLELYKEGSPIFDAYGITSDINSIFRSQIYLPSGGNIVIEQTEALCAIDINSGGYTGKKNYESTITKINTEAAFEIARQIRLRDLSGIMIIDFIDMEKKDNQSKVFDAIKKAMKNDRARYRIYPFNSVGLVEITRKRTRTKPEENYSETCPLCKGMGKLLSKQSIALEIVRWIQGGEFIIQGKDLMIDVNPDIYLFLKDNFDSFFSNQKSKINISSQKNLPYDQFKVHIVD